MRQPCAFPVPFSQKDHWLDGMLQKSGKCLQSHQALVVKSSQHSKGWCSIVGLMFSKYTIFRTRLSRKFPVHLVCSKIHNPPRQQWFLECPSSSAQWWMDSRCGSKIRPGLTIDGQLIFVNFKPRLESRLAWRPNKAFSAADAAIVR